MPKQKRRIGVIQYSLNMSASMQQHIFTTYAQEEPGTICVTYSRDRNLETWFNRFDSINYYNFSSWSECCSDPMFKIHVFLCTNNITHFDILEGLFEPMIRLNAVPRLPRIIYYDVLEDIDEPFIGIEWDALAALAREHNHLMHSTNGNVEECDGKVISILENELAVKPTYKKYANKIVVMKDGDPYTLNESLTGKDVRLFKLAKKSNLSVKELETRCVKIFVDLISSSRMKRILKFENREEMQKMHLQSAFHYHNRGQTLDSKLYVYVLSRYNFYRKHTQGLLVSSWIKKYQVSKAISQMFNFGEITGAIKGLLELGGLVNGIGEMIAKVAEFIQLKITQVCDLFGLDNTSFAVRCFASVLLSMVLVNCVKMLGENSVFVVKQLYKYFCPSKDPIVDITLDECTSQVISQTPKSQFGDISLVSQIFTLAGLMICDKKSTFTAKLNGSRSSAGIVELIFKNIKEFIDWCVEKCFGVHLFSQDNGLDYVVSLINRCEQFLNTENIQSLVIEDKKYADQCLSMYEELLACKSDIIRDSKNYGPMFNSSFGQLCVEMRSLYFKTLSGSALIHQRCVPPIIYIKGAPKQGKSTLMNYIMSGVHHKLRTDPDLKEILSDKYNAKFNSKMVFPRTTGQAYWEGYHHQWAVTYDDIFAQKDPALKEITASELLRAADSTAFLLNMAFGEKGTKYFTSDLILATANNWDFNNVGLQTSGGLRRRVTFPIEVQRVGHFDPKKPDWNAWEITLFPDGFTNGVPNSDLHDLSKDYANASMNILQFINLVYNHMKTNMLNKTVGSAGLDLDWEEISLEEPPKIKPKGKERAESQMLRYIANTFSQWTTGEEVHHRPVQFYNPINPRKYEGTDGAFTIGRDVYDHFKGKNYDMHALPDVWEEYKETAKYLTWKELGEVEHHPTPICAKCLLPYIDHRNAGPIDQESAGQYPHTWCCGHANGRQICMDCGVPVENHIDQLGKIARVYTDCEYVPSSTCLCGASLRKDFSKGQPIHTRCHGEYKFRQNSVCTDCGFPGYTHNLPRDSAELNHLGDYISNNMAHYLGLALMGYLATKHLVLPLFKRIMDYFWPEIDETEEVAELQQAKYSKYRDRIVKPKFSLEKQAESHMTNQDMNLAARCGNILNQVFDIVITDGTEETFGKVFFVSPTMAIITSHSYLCLSLQPCKVEISISDEVKLRFSSAEFKIRKLSGERDGAILTLNTGLQNVRNITKQFFKEKIDRVPSVHRLMKLYKDDILTHCYQGGGDAEWKDKYLTATATLGTKEHKTPMKGYYIFRNGKGLNGYCSFPCVTFDNRYQNQFIFGIHVGRVGDDSIICPIYQSDFESIDKIESQCDWRFPNASHFSEDVLTKGPKGTVPFGAPKYSVEMVTKSELNKSPLYEHLPEEWNLSRPRILTKIPSGSPLAKAHAKIERFPNCAMPERLGYMLEVQPDDLFEGFVPRTGQYKMLSFEEALFGNKDDVGSLEASSSAGYPHVQQKLKPKKRDWFDPSTGWFDPDLKVKVESQIEEMAQGVLFTQTVCDQLKDELGANENTDPNDFANLKTRLFGVVEMESCIRTKMVLGDFITQTKKHRLFGSVAVATNPHNLDWKLLYEKAFVYGEDRAIGGDIKSMDVSTRRYMVQVAMRFFEWYYALKRGSREWNLIRSTLFSVMSSVHVIQNVAYMTYDGNSSGNWITTFMNCLSVWTYLAVVFYHRRPPTCDFRFCDKVSVVLYGDDNTGSVSPDVDFYSNVELSSDMELLCGVGFTLPSKSIVTERFLSKSDLVFLSRRFIKEEYFVRAPLEKESLFGMLFFVRGETYEERVQMVRQNIDVFLQEMAHFTQEEAQLMIDVICEACSKAGLPFVDLSGVYRQARRVNYTHPTY